MVDETEEEIRRGIPLDPPSHPCMMTVDGGDDTAIEVPWDLESGRATDEEQPIDPFKAEWDSIDAAQRRRRVTAILGLVALGTAGGILGMLASLVSTRALIIAVESFSLCGLCATLPALMLWRREHEFDDVDRRSVLLTPASVYTEHIFWRVMGATMLPLIPFLFRIDELFNRTQDKISAFRDDLRQGKVRAEKLLVAWLIGAIALGLVIMLVFSK